MVLTIAELFVQQSPPSKSQTCQLNISSQYPSPILESFWAVSSLRVRNNKKVQIWVLHPQTAKPIYFEIRRQHFQNFNFRVSNLVRLFELGIWQSPTAPSDYFLPLKEQDGTLQSNEANTGVFVKTRSLQKLQRKMTVLYEKQKEKGALVQNNFSSWHFATPSNYLKMKLQLYINLWYYFVTL